MNMGCLILVIIFLFSIILSEYDIPEEDLPIIGIITIIVFITIEQPKLIRNIRV